MMKPCLPLALCCVVSCPVWAQAPVAPDSARYEYVDQSAPYSNPPTPQLVALGTPRLGTSFRLRVPPSWLTPMSFCFPPRPEWQRCQLLIGSRNPSIDLGPMGIQGRLLSSAEVILATPGSAPYAGPQVMSFAIPRDTALIGVEFHQQVYCEFDVCGTGRWVSRGGRGVIGF